jgi:hypothetical protein
LSSKGDKDRDEKVAYDCGELHEARAKDHFARITKSFVSEMTPPQKLSQRALRKELRQKPMRFSVAWSGAG